MALTALFLRERRSRELSGLFVLAMLVVVVPVGVFFASLEWGGRVPSQLAAAVDALALTPLGAAWAFPGRVAQGGMASATPALLVAVATLVLLALSGCCSCGGCSRRPSARVGARARRPRMVRGRAGHAGRRGRRAQPHVLVRATAATSSTSS